MTTRRERRRSKAQEQPDAAGIQLNTLVCKATQFKQKLEREEIFARVIPKRDKPTRRNRNPEFYFEVVVEPEYVRRIQSSWRGVKIKVLPSKTYMGRPELAKQVASGNTLITIPKKKGIVLLNEMNQYL